jgi:outer membrane lipoprotein-sorting protein
MSLLRTLPTRRLIALLVAAAALVAGGTAIALGAVGGGPVPRAKPLAKAVHDAAAAPEVSGITARITFTNKLIDSSSLEGGGPLLKGASGRLWLGDGHRLRLELQTDNGDAQIVSNGTDAWVYDSGSHTVYRAKLPQDGKQQADSGKVPSLAEIQKSIDELTGKADLSRATPGNVAGQPAYTVRISPKHDGGLLGGAAIAWDAAKGVPLRAAIYAQGNRTPVLELKAEDISYGKVPASDFAVSPPADAKVVNVDVPSGAGAKHEAAGARKADKAVTGVGAVSKALPFKLTAPKTLVGLPRHEVRLIDWKGKKAAVVTYGRNLGGMVVIQQPAEPAAAKAKAPSQGDHHHGGGLKLPAVSINGATGQELDTALATMIRFERGGVAYTVLGSVPPAAAQAAARGL